jgi:ribosomal protein L29
VNISRTVRQFRDGHVRNMGMEELAESLDTLKRRLGDKINAEAVAELTREDRKVR